MTDIIEQIKTQPFGPVLQREVIEEIERLRKENQSVKAFTWAQAGEIDKLSAENYRLTNKVKALQSRLYLNKINHTVEEEESGRTA